jgi:hypothetical protein
MCSAGQHTLLDSHTRRRQCLAARWLHRKSDSLYRVCHPSNRPSSICGREIENEEKKLTLSECIRRKERKMPLRLVILFANFYRGRQRESFAWGGGEERGGRERASGLKNYSAHSSFINIPRMLISKFAVLIKSCWRSSLLHLIFMILQLDIYTKCRAKSGRNPPVHHHSLCFFQNYKREESFAHNRLRHFHRFSVFFFRLTKSNLRRFIWIYFCLIPNMHFEGRPMA